MLKKIPMKNVDSHFPMLQVAQIKFNSPPLYSGWWRKPETHMSKPTKLHTLLDTTSDVKMWFL